MPPVTLQTIPVPAQAMHSRNPRRSTPSLFAFSFIRRDNCFLLLQQRHGACVSLSSTDPGPEIFPVCKIFFPRDQLLPEDSPAFVEVSGVTALSRRRSTRAHPYKRSVSASDRRASR